MAGFADEVKQAASGRSEAAPAAVVDAAVKAESADAPKSLENQLFEQAIAQMAKGAGEPLAVGRNPVDDKAKELPQPEEMDPAKQLETKPKIRIGAREFTTVEDAMDYAQELEMKAAQDQGFIEGVKAASKEEKKEEARQKLLEEEVEEILFEDPKAAIAKLKAGIRKEIFDEYERMTVAQAQEAERVQRAQSAWSGFFKDNSDLSEAEQYVRYVFQRDEAELGPMKPEQGLKVLADRARKELRIQRVASLPKQEMPSAPAIMTGASGANTGAGGQSTPAEKVDFVSQVNKLRKRG